MNSGVSSKRSLTRRTDDHKLHQIIKKLHVVVKSLSEKNKSYESDLVYLRTQIFTQKADLKNNAQDEIQKMILE